MSILSSPASASPAMFALATRYAAVVNWHVHRDLAWVGELPEPERRALIADLRAEWIWEQEAARVEQAFYGAVGEGR